MKRAAPMDVLLAGNLGTDERAAWSAALSAALPEARWWWDDAPFPAAMIEAAVVANPAPGRLQGLPRLRLIQSLWAGVDRLLGDPTLPEDVPVARMVDPAMNEAMAETALWATLSLHRGFFAYARQQAGGLWQQHPQRRADEVRATVLGTGQMGQATLRRLQQQGYRAAGWRRADGPQALAPLLARSDVVINLLPLTPQTAGMLGAPLFAALPRGAGIVNLARGGHLVEADLLAALDSGHIGHAVLDVFAAEPLPPVHPFWSHPRITVLPHVAAQTDPRSAARVAAANLRALRDGLPLQHLVDRTRGY
ncbi:glyoxylate/hydroxypyruvate reductase A [Aquincola sp. MAHUQ-54]|uniref:Glyoxylate/hydroxypyruvate reductase A n=1 Tax=Aquincola agrisoli TaxID=3119538 RepID=A0AAW9Q8R4_9BURK